MEYSKDSKISLTYSTISPKDHISLVRRFSRRRRSICTSSNNLVLSRPAISRFKNLQSGSKNQSGPAIMSSAATSLTTCLKSTGMSMKDGKSRRSFRMAHSESISEPPVFIMACLATRAWISCRIGKMENLRPSVRNNICINFSIQQIIWISRFLTRTNCTTAWSTSSRSTRIGSLKSARMSASSIWECATFPRMKP